MKSQGTKKIIFRILIALLIVFIGIQFISAEKSNPPVTGAMVFPQDVKSIIQRSCLDCHSNETVWPWYSSIAPVSWLVSKDVAKGRKKLNFSEWDSYTDKRQRHKLKEILEEIDEGEMPMPIYTFIHSDATLTDNEKEIIRNWVNSLTALKDSVVNQEMD